MSKTHLNDHRIFVPTVANHDLDHLNAPHWTELNWTELNLTVNSARDHYLDSHEQEQC